MRYIPNTIKIKSQLIKLQKLTLLIYAYITNCLILGDLNLDPQHIKEFIDNNENIIIPYDYQNSITFPDNNEQLDYFLLYNMFRNKKLVYYVFDDIFYSDHFPIMLDISPKKYYLRKKIKVEYID